VGRATTARFVAQMSLPLLLAAATGLMLLPVVKPPAAAQELGAMAADCEGNTRQLDTACQFGDGQEFSVAVQIVSPPAQGYAAFQVRLRWDANVLDYQPTEQTSREAVWPHCGIPARDVGPAGDTVLFACIPFPIEDPPELFEDTGTVLLFTFRCATPGTSEVALVAPQAGSALETYFLDSLGQPAGVSSLEPARVTCGGAAVTRPEPEVTPGVDILSPEGELVPPDEQVPFADVETVVAEGTATPVAAATLAGTAEATPTEEEAAAEEEDGDGDGGVWVWAVIGVVALAAAGGAGLLVWRRRARASRA